MYKIAYKKTLRFFFKNPAQSVLPPYNPLTSCEISEKFNTRLLRFAPDGRTNGLFFDCYNSTKVENCNFLPE